MGFIEKVKDFTKSIFTKSEDTEEIYNFISVPSMEAKYEEGEYMEAAKNLKQLLERYGERKKKNHRRKGREFIHFILSNKHKDLKNIGYQHWENVEKFIKLNQEKVYEYHKKNLRKAMDFFEKEIKSLTEIKIPTNK